MADHNVTLKYAPNGDFSADPFSVSVRPGETIAFALDASIPGASFLVTFAEPHLFRGNNPSFHVTGEFRHEDGEITVASLPPGRTSYHCVLKGPDGEKVGESKENRGGEVVPAN